MIPIILSIATSFAYATTTSLTEAFSPSSQRRNNVQRHDDGRLQPIKNHPTPSFRRNYFLIPLSKAWDFSANNSNSNDHRPETMKCETFASLVPKLGCTSLDSDGALTTSAAGEYYKLFGAESPVIQRDPLDETDPGKVVGWRKRSSRAPTHFWDVMVYNFAAKDIYLDILMREAFPKIKNASTAGIFALLAEHIEKYGMQWG